MSFQSLPNEILLIIAKNLGPKELNSLLQCNHHLELLLTPLLHKLALQKKDGSLATLWAARHGHEPLMRLLVEKGADFGGPSHMGKLLLEASERGHVETVKFLLQHFDPNDYGLDESPLYKAARYGHGEIVRMLLDSGVDLERTYGMYTPLARAVCGGYESIVKLLLDRGANIKFCFYSQSLYDVARNHGHEELARLLKSRGCAPRWVHSASNVEFLHAVSSGDEVKVKRLLENMTAYTREKKTSYRPLEIAAQKGNVSMMKLLLDYKGFDTKFGTWYSLRVSLYRAAAKGHQEAVLFLVNREPSTGGRISIAGCQDPLYEAVHSGHEAVVRILLAKGANPNYIGMAPKYYWQRTHGYSALHLAAQKGNPGVLKALLEAGGDPTIRNRVGATALHGAYDLRTVRLLLQSGVYDWRKVIDDTLPLPKWIADVVFGGDV